MKMKKALLMVLCAVALVVSTVFGTLAYLTDDDAVTNTFTVGKVDIKLDEADVDDSTADADRDQANKYHLLPGETYAKDPTVTVLSGSEESYVRMIMTVHNASAVQAIIDADDVKDDAGNVTGKGAVEDYADLFSDWDNAKWLYQGWKTGAADNSIEFEFWYHETVDGYSVNGEGRKVAEDCKLEALFKNVVVPGYVTNDQLAALYGDSNDAEGDFKIEVKAHAIQAAGFDDAAAAWAQFTEN